MHAGQLTWWVKNSAIEEASGVGFKAPIQTNNHGEGNESNEGDEEERRQKEVGHEKEEVNDI